MSGPIHCRNHTLDLILSHGIDVNGIEILQQCDDIQDQLLSISKSSEKCDVLTETVDSLFSSTLDTVAPYA